MQQLRQLLMQQKKCRVLKDRGAELRHSTPEPNTSGNNATGAQLRHTTPIVRIPYASLTFGTHARAQHLRQYCQRRSAPAHHARAQHSPAPKLSTFISRITASLCESEEDGFSGVPEPEHFDVSRPAPLATSPEALSLAGATTPP